MRPRIASTSADETRPATSRDSEALDEPAPGFRVRGGPYRADERERPAAIRDRAHQVHDRVDEAPGEVAAQGGGEHRPDFLVARRPPRTRRPTKVSAMNRPKSSSDTRSTGLSTGSRTSFSMTFSPLIAIHLMPGSFNPTSPLSFRDSDPRLGAHQTIASAPCSALATSGSNRVCATAWPAYFCSPVIMPARRQQLQVVRQRRACCPRPAADRASLCRRESARSIGTQARTVAAAAPACPRA